MCHEKLFALFQLNLLSGTKCYQDFEFSALLSLKDFCKLTWDDL